MARTSTIASTAVWLGGAPLADPDPVPVGEPERLEALLAGIDQDGHAGGRGDLARGHQGKFVLQVQRVLDQTDHLEGAAVLIPAAAEVQTEGRGDASP